MKGERTRQIALVLLGLFFLALVYPLYTDLLKNETEPMFYGFFISLGPFLLIAARKPSASCQKALGASISHCLQRVLEPGSRGRDDHSNGGSMATRR